MQPIGRIAAVLAAALALAGPAMAQRAAPDPLASLPGEISAILDLGAAPRLLVVETDHEVSNSRMLGLGDEYRAGWRIDGIGAQTIALRKGEQRRTIEVPSRLRTTELAAAGADGPAIGAAAFRGFAGSNAAGGRAGQARIFTGPPAGGRGAGGAGAFALPPGLPPELQAQAQAFMAQMQQGGGLPDMAGLVEMMSSGLQNVQVQENNGVRTVTTRGPDGQTTTVTIGQGGQLTVDGAAVPPDMLFSRQRR